MNKEKQIEHVKKTAWIVALLFGLICLFREIVFWDNLYLMKQNFPEINNAVSHFQNDFLKKAEEMNQRGMRLKKIFDDRETKFHERFNSLSQGQEK